MRHLRFGETASDEGETLGTALRAMNASPRNPLARYDLGGQAATGLCERSTFGARR